METAIVLPLTIFLFLGTLQLFMILQARILSEYAIFRAARAGSVGYGDCRPMRHAALAVLMPAITRASTPADLGAAFQKRRNNRYDPTEDRAGNRPLTGPIIWIAREHPTLAEIPIEQDREFDTTYNPMRLEMKMIFWFPMRIPFANWVMAYMFLTHFGLATYDYTNPILPTEKNAGWPDTAAGNIDAAVGAEFKTRVQAGEYVFPIQTNYTMRMMTPAKVDYFDPGKPYCNTLW